jgi:surfeit locus 1 family protein
MNIRYKKWLVLILMLGGMLITASLGRWQLQRAAEKEQYVAAIQEKMSYPVLRNAQLIAASQPEQWVHQPVQLQGTWLAHRTVLLDNRQMDGRVGFFVLTPLLLADANWVVWVQRGWIPRDFQDRSRIHDFVTPTGMVLVPGLMAPPPSKIYDFAKAEQGQIRQNLDFSAEKWEPGLTAFPLLVRQTGEPTEGLQRNWAQVDAGIAKHYGYAFQWFGLCGLMGFLLIWFQWLAPWYNRNKKVTDHA